MPMLLGMTAAFGVAAAQTAKPSPGAALFEKACYSCHNINGGDKVGPDLKGLTQRRTPDWVRSFVPSPAAKQRSGDPAAVELFKKFSPTVMPDQALSPDQIDQVIALIEEFTTNGQQFIPAGARLKRPIRPGDADLGYRLFTGADPLASGAPPCISCHSIDRIGSLGGGTLGPDLTGANIKYRDPALIAILQNPNFPTMASVFGRRPLKDEEIVRLFALLQRESATLSHAPVTTGGGLGIQSRFALAGAGALLAALGAMSLIWRKRLNGVRQSLVRSNRA